jgi:hypothetical protein
MRSAAFRAWFGERPPVEAVADAVRHKTVPQHRASFASGMTALRVAGSAKLAPAPFSATANRKCAFIVRGRHVLQRLKDPKEIPLGPAESNAARGPTHLRREHSPPPAQRVEQMAAVCPADFQRGAVRQADALIA